MKVKVYLVIGIIFLIINFNPFWEYWGFGFPMPLIGLSMGQCTTNVIVEFGTISEFLFDAWFWATFYWISTKVPK